jgi:hypothetical protein
MVLVEPNDYQIGQGVKRIYTLRTLGPAKAPTALKVKKINLPQRFTWDHEKIYTSKQQTTSVISPQEWRSIFDDEEDDFSSVPK